MTLLEALKLASANAIDSFKAIADAYGAEATVSIVIGHPGTVEDSFIVGEHEVDNLFAILTRLQTGPRVESDVTSRLIGPEEFFAGRDPQ